MTVKEQLINDIQLLPENFLLDISAVIKERVALNTKQINADISAKRRSMFGCMKGETWVSDDFDAPLEELKEYME